MRSFLIATVLLWGTWVPCAGQVEEGAEDPDFLWARTDQCLKHNLFRKMPGLILALEERGKRKPALAPRCHFEAARLQEKLGADEEALRSLKRAMRHPEVEYGRKAALVYARTLSRRGGFSAATRILRALQNRIHAAAGDTGMGSAEVDIEFARVCLETGRPGKALRFCERARLKMDDEALESDRQWNPLRYETAFLEGRALGSLGAPQNAMDRYWSYMEKDPDGCAMDPRIALALEHMYRVRGRVPQLRAYLGGLVRRGGPLTAATTLLEYLDLKAMVDKGNTPGLLTEIEGIDPPLWSDGKGPDWHYFQAARALVEKQPDRARDAVLSHIDRNGYFTFGAYILGLVGDEKSLKALYRLAVSVTSHRDIQNITTALARNQRDLARRFLERLQRDASAAHPTEVRRAAKLALQSFPPAGQPIH